MEQGSLSDQTDAAHALLKPSKRDLLTHLQGGSRLPKDQPMALRKAQLHCYNCGESCLHKKDVPCKKHRKTQPLCKHLQDLTTCTKCSIQQPKKMPPRLPLWQKLMRMCIQHCLHIAALLSDKIACLASKYLLSLVHLKW